MTEQERVLYERWRAAVIRVAALREEFWITPQPKREGVWNRFRRAMDRREDAETAMERAILLGDRMREPTGEGLDGGTAL